MQPDYKEKLLGLRQRLQVGVQQALQLLEKTHGDVAAAEALFVQGTVAALVAAEGVTVAEAERHLRQHQYNVYLATKAIEEEKYGLTERILKRFAHDPAEAAEQVAGAVDRQQPLPRSYSWLDLPALPALLPPPVCCLVSVVEWLNYADYEGFAYALYFYHELVADWLNEPLQLPELAAVLRRARAVHEAQRERQEQLLRRQGHVGPTPEFAAAEALFQQLRPALFPRLYALVLDHLDQFPR